jgi:hypothetical protein
MNGFEREVGEVKLSPGHIDSDREWRFDSLCDALNQERSDGSSPTREYADAVTVGLKRIRSLRSTMSMSHTFVVAKSLLSFCSLKSLA